MKLGSFIGILFCLLFQGASFAAETKLPNISKTSSDQEIILFFESLSGLINARLTYFFEIYDEEVYDQSEAFGEAARALNSCQHLSMSEKEKPYEKFQRVFGKYLHLLLNPEHAQFINDVKLLIDDAGRAKIPQNLKAREGQKNFKALLDLRIQLHFFPITNEWRNELDVIIERFPELKSGFCKIILFHEKLQSEFLNFCRNNADFITEFAASKNPCCHISNNREFALLVNNIYAINMAIFSAVKNMSVSHNELDPEAQRQVKELIEHIESDKPRMVIEAKYNMDLKSHEIVDNLDTALQSASDFFIKPKSGK